MTTDFRALCAELLDELEYHTDWSIAESLKAKARAALADKSADTDQVLNLAAIIREVDGGNNKGAAALAESILDHPRFRAVLADAMEKAILEKAKSNPNKASMPWTQRQKELIENFRSDMAATGSLVPTYWTTSSAYEIAMAGIEAVKQTILDDQS